MERKSNIYLVLHLGRKFYVWSLDSHNETMKSCMDRGSNLPFVFAGLDRGNGELDAVDAPTAFHAVRSGASSSESKKECHGMFNKLLLSITENTL